MMNYEEMALLDSILIRKIEESQKNNNRTDQQLGEQAFGWMKSPKMKLQSIKGYGERKQQQLRLADFINLCEALGLSWQKECAEAIREVKNSAQNK